MFFRNVWNRADGLLELTNETRGKVIIWSRFVRSIEKIEEALAGEYGPESVVTYYGATEKEDRAGAIKRFQNDEKTRFFVGNQQTAGYGITLTVASTVIYFSNSFDLAARMQSEDRCHRIGQTKSVTYIDMVCPKTIDEKILKALKDKKNVSDLIMGKGDENFFM
jgi:SNF2 family DNA or RNA helicase